MSKTSTDSTTGIDLEAMLAAAVSPEQAKQRRAIAVSGPYIGAEEDWMLLRALGDYARAGRLAMVVLVKETTFQNHRKEEGISIWRIASYRA